MAQSYFSLVTNVGRSKLAISAAGGAPLRITHFAIGDGNGADTSPTPASTRLVREVWRTPVDGVRPDPDNPSALIISAIIPTAAGGWWMREMGIFDAQGDMLAVAKPVSQYKPTAMEGQLEDIRYEFQIVVGDTSAVTLLVDPSAVYATREWVMSNKLPMSQLLTTPFVPVKSVSLSSAPAGASTGDLYVIPGNASGIWAQHIGKVAEWSGTSWTMIATPDGHAVGTPDGTIWRKIAGIYVAVPVQEYASDADHLAGELATKMAHPKGVNALITKAIDDLRTSLSASAMITANTVAMTGQEIWADTGAAAITVTLPLKPGAGATLFVGRRGTNPLTIARNGQTIEGVADNFLIDVDRRGVWLTFVGGTWRLKGEVLAK